MVSDACFGGVPTVLSGCRGRQMPFDVRRPGYERDIVQVDDLPLGVSGAVEYTGKKRMKHLQLQVKLWLAEYQPVVLDGCVMTDPSILRYCGKYSQLMHHPKQCKILKDMPFQQEWHSPKAFCIFGSPSYQH